MSERILIEPVEVPVVGSIRPPGSKSITNRALVCAALADGVSTLTGTLDSEDTQAMLTGLQALGFEIECLENNTRLIVHGMNGSIPTTEAEVFVGNSGTTVRFLGAMVALGHGAFSFDGVARMRERPIQDLLEALEQLGANARSDNENDCPPFTVHSNGITGGLVSIRGNISSQFLSGLLMAVPCAKAATAIKVEGDLVSRPYIDMTLKVMQAFGVDVICEEENKFIVPDASAYTACDYEIEPDASAASYFWAAAAITSGKVMVDGLHRNSLQGDVAFCDCLEAMGCNVTWEENAVTVEGGKLCGIDVDMNAISDTVQTLAVVALFAEGPTNISNVAHIRHKETDRISDLATELRKLGATVEEREDGLTITPGKLVAAEIETYNDHRMAMSFAVAGLNFPGITILNPVCTHKTYPKFFDDLSQLTKK